MREHLTKIFYLVVGITLGRLMSNPTPYDLVITIGGIFLILAISFGTWLMDKSRPGKILLAINGRRLENKAVLSVKYEPNENGTFHLAVDAGVANEIAETTLTKIGLRLSIPNTIRVIHFKNWQQGEELNNRTKYFVAQLEDIHHGAVSYVKGVNLALEIPTPGTYRIDYAVVGSMNGKGFNKIERYFMLSVYA